MGMRPREAACQPAPAMFRVRHSQVTGVFGPERITVSDDIDQPGPAY